MISSQALGHFSVALYRIRTLRQEPGCRVAGKGLLISFQCLLGRLKATLVTCRSQSPTLHIEMVRSPRQQAFTPPMQVDPVTASFPEGTAPDTATLFAPVGSSLVTVIVPAFAPKLVGWKRSGQQIEVPVPLTIGEETTAGTRKSAEDDVTLSTDKGQEPLLLIVSSRSTNAPTHTLPKLPLSPTTVVILGVPRRPVADKSTTGASGSLLTIRIVAVSSVPAIVGLYLTVKSRCSPAAITTGVPGVARTEKPVDPIRRCTLVVTRSLLPTLKISSARNCGPWQTVPNSRSFSRLTAIEGPCGLTNSKAPRP